MINDLYFKKYQPIMDEDLINQGKQWIQSVLNQEIKDFYLDLKDGIVLCNLMNEILPNSCKLSRNKNLPFHQMENINQFIRAARQLGVPDYENFELNDLYEQKGIKQVLICLSSVSRHASKLGWEGPIFGPKLCEQKKYNFSEEVLKKGENMASLQDGFFVDMSSSTVNDGGIRRQITKENNYLRTKENEE